MRCVPAAWWMAHDVEPRAPVGEKCRHGLFALFDVEAAKAAAAGSRRATYAGYFARSTSAKVNCVDGSGN